MGKSLSYKILENHLIDGIGRHIANIPQTTNIFDESGHTKYTRRQNTIINNLNQKNNLSV